MREAEKIQGAPHIAGREVLLGKRLDAGNRISRLSLEEPLREDPVEISDLPARVCRYAKCPNRLRGHTFQPKRRAQEFCSAKCRKADWFDSHFIKIMKP